jgi:hypothetical protein
MQITLPLKSDATTPSIDVKKMVVIGANGSGKTRFGTDIENRYNRITHRIAAQKSLSMPKEVSPKSYDRANTEFLYGYYAQNNRGNPESFKLGQRWGEHPNTFLLNDYDKLMVLLHTDEYEESIKFKSSYVPGQECTKPITKLDRIKKIWEYMLPHRKLLIKAGSIETYSNSSTSYNASEMSDGERVIFYLIGEIICVPENTLVIIDEPEMHVHKSILSKLWDLIENERPDCAFIYLTHDIEFAISRESAERIWIKSYNGTSWDYEFIPSNNNLPEQLYLEILGSRKPVLFIEGDKSSIDFRLLSLTFDDYTTKPLGSCNKVLMITKSFKEEESFHHIQSNGLIDRDRRTDEEIELIKKDHIWITKVAEIENFLLLEPIVKQVAIKMLKDPEDVFIKVKNNVINFFGSELETQALLHSITYVEKNLNEITNFKSLKTIGSFKSSIASISSSIDVESIYNEKCMSFQGFIQREDYISILSVFNNKGIIANSQISQLCDLNTKNDAYLNMIIGLIKEDGEPSKIIKDTIKASIEM